MAIIILNMPLELLWLSQTSVFVFPQDVQEPEKLIPAIAIALFYWEKTEAWFLFLSGRPKMESATGRSETGSVTRIIQEQT